MSEYNQVLSYTLLNYDKDNDVSKFKTSFKLISEAQQNSVKFFKDIIDKLIKGQRENIDETNKSFYIRLFKDLDKNTQEYIEKYLSEKFEIDYSEIYSYIKEKTENQQEFNEKITQKFKDFVKELEDNILEFKQKNIDQTLARNKFDQKVLDRVDKNLKLDREKFSKDKKSILDKLETKKKKEKEERLYDKSDIKNAIKYQQTNYINSINLFNKFIKMNQNILKRFDYTRYRMYLSGDFSKSIKNIEISKGLNSRIQNVTNYTTIHQLNKNQDSSRYSGGTQFLYLTKDRIKKIIQFSTSKVKNGLTKIGSLFTGIGDILLQWAKFQFSKNGSWGKIITGSLKFLLGPLYLLVNVVKGIVVILKAGLWILKGAIKLVTGIVKTTIKLATFIFKNVFALGKYIAKKVIALFSLIKKTKAYKVTKKAFLLFLTTPTGAYLLGFALGFLFGKFTLVYTSLKTNFLKIKEEYIDPVFQPVIDFLNGDNSVIEALDNMLDDGFQRIVQKIEEVIDFIIEIPYMLEATWEDIKANAGRTASSFGGGIAGSIIGGVIGGPFGMILGGIIGEYLGGAIYDFINGYYYTPSTNAIITKSKLIHTAKKLGNNVSKYVMTLGDNYFTSNLNNGADLSFIQQMPPSVTSNPKMSSSILFSKDTLTSGTSSSSPFASTKNKTFRYKNVEYDYLNPQVFIEKLNGDIETELRESKKELRRICTEYNVNDADDDMFPEHAWVSKVPLINGGLTWNVPKYTSERGVDGFINGSGFRLARAAILRWLILEFAHKNISFDQLISSMQDLTNPGSALYQNITIKSIYKGWSEKEGRTWFKDLFITRPEAKSRDDYKKANKSTIDLKTMRRNWFFSEARSDEESLTRLSESTQDDILWQNGGNSNLRSNIFFKLHPKKLSISEYLKLGVYGNTSLDDILNGSFIYDKNGDLSAGARKRVSQEMVNALKQQVYNALSKASSIEEADRISEEFIRSIADDEIYKAYRQSFLTSGRLTPSTPNISLPDVNLNSASNISGDNPIFSMDEDDQNDLSRLNDQFEDIEEDREIEERLIGQLEENVGNMPSRTAVVPLVSSRSKEPSPSERENADN